MTAPPSFGRRRPVAAPVPHARTASPVDPARDRYLSPAAEAFRAELAASRRADDTSFAAWRRGQRGRRLLSALVTVGSFSPGLVSFLLDAPLWASIGLEVAALAGNVWLRRERWRRRREIVAWEEPAG